MSQVRVYVDVEDVLDELDDDELIAALESRGWRCTKAAIVHESLSDEPEGFNRIAHLVNCGLYADAKTEALRMIENEIGKPNILTAHQEPS